MADAGVAQVFGNVSTALGAQGVNQIVQPFEGEPKKFKEWVKSMKSMPC